MTYEGHQLLVVSALILDRTGRVLLTQRPAGKADFPLKWESPGGKIEPGETGQQALRRELIEELGIVVTRFADRDVLGQDLRPALGIYQLFLHVVVFHGEPRPLEGQGIGWFTAEEMLALELSPGNERAARDLSRWIREQGRIRGLTS